MTSFVNLITYVKCPAHMPPVTTTKRRHHIFCSRRTRLTTVVATLYIAAAHYRKCAGGGVLCFIRIFRTYAAKYYLAQINFARVPEC
ncbi:jg2991 [Pararge aegeria aegeria]|uniref:Jg2991 protein n=1 Tax=Pararge aegeria aegeria TaxID=348720 RepID=A0A8S4SBU2_9NEOP|nr:jg2991 [Pararge aegeria aegeria]